MDLFRAHHRAGHDGGRRAQREAHEAAAAEAGQLVAVAVALADALHALREHPHQLALAQQALAVLLAGPHRAAAGEGGGEEGQEGEHVEDEHPALAAGGVLVAQGEGDHHAVPGQDAGVVGDDERRPFGGDVLDAGRLDPPPHRVEELEQRADRLNEPGVAAELVHVFRVPGEVGGAPQIGDVLPPEAMPSGLQRAGEGDEQALPARRRLRSRIALGLAAGGRTQEHDLRPRAHAGASAARARACGWR